MATPPLPFKVKTIVSWAGEEEGDLGFLENEIIEVFSIVDESWWNGKLRRNNAEGIFPRDYVELLEDKMSQSSSYNNTPTKQQYVQSNRSNNSTPQLFKSTPKKINPLNNPNVSLEYDDANGSFDTSYEYGERGFKSFGYSPSSNRVSNSRNRMSYQVDGGDNSKFQQASRSMHDLKRLSLQDKGSRQQPIKSQSYMDIRYKEDSGSKPRRKNKTEQELLYEFEEIAKKKAILEMELQRLKQLEQQPQQQYSKPRTSPLSQPNPSVDSYSDERTSDLSKKLSRYVTDEDEEEDEDVEGYGYTYAGHASPPTPPTRDESPPPPPPPKYSNFDMEQQFGRTTVGQTNNTSFRQSQSQGDIDLLRLSQQQQALTASIKSLQSDVLNLSELSATSAGSFMRHKYDKEMNEAKLPQELVEEQHQEEASEPSVMDSVFQEKKSKHPKIFSMLLRKSHTEPSLNPLERKQQEQEHQQQHMDWATFKMHINRMNSLTSQEKQARTKRVVREEGNLIIKPLDYVSEINTNETVGEIIAFDNSDVKYSKVASFMDHYNHTSDMNDMISDISVKFHGSKLNQIRCVMLHMCKFHIIEETNKISMLKPKLKDVQYKGEASIYQINYLCKKILDALRIPSEIIPGFWKKPNEFYHNEQFVINHCWLSVLVNDSYRIMDIYNFKHGNICNLSNKYNEFYWLAEPLAVVSTHIPSIIDLQHVIPPIDPNIAFYLPRTYSGFYNNHLSFKNFNNALTRLKDLEIFELELEIPYDVELFTLVKTSKITTNELSLSQIKWVNHKRIAKIKAILPEKESIGVLQIFSGAKGLQKHFDNIHELSIVIPLYHQGNHKSTSFVQRFPTVQSQNNDLYIIKPQVNKLLIKQAYNFEIEQYPSQGITTTSTTSDFKLVVESPSGKYFPLNKDDESKPYGVYSANLKCSELGVYRGLVIGDSGTSWYVFAQWECIT
ncbi:Cytokinesis protein 3 [Spathaspora sp. JA1]|nr:Cytokinesis protein 3 [Spathaspora sp. JA1]